MYNFQCWAFSQIGPQIRKLRTEGFDLRICEPISFREHFRICGKNLKSTANPQNNNIAGMFLCYLQKNKFLHSDMLKTDYNWNQWIKRDYLLLLSLESECMWLWQLSLILF